MRIVHVNMAESEGGGEGVCISLIGTGPKKILYAANFFFLSTYFLGLDLELAGSIDKVRHCHALMQSYL